MSLFITCPVENVERAIAAVNAEGFAPKAFASPEETREHLERNGFDVDRVALRQDRGGGRLDRQRGDLARQLPALPGERRSARLSRRLSPAQGR